MEKERIDAIFPHHYSLTRNSMPFTTMGFSFLFLSVGCASFFKVIGSYKHTVYYVMQIGAITLASML